MGGIQHLVHFGCGHILAVNPTNAFAVEVDFQHDLGCRFPVFAEKLLQHQHDELHGGVVVIEHDDLIHQGRLGALCNPLQHDRNPVIGLGHDFGIGWFSSGHFLILVTLFQPQEQMVFHHFLIKKYI